MKSCVVSVRTVWWLLPSVWVATRVIQVGTLLPVGSRARLARLFPEALQRLFQVVERPLDLSKVVTLKPYCRPTVATREG